MKLKKTEKNNTFSMFSRHIKIRRHMNAAEIYTDYLLWCDPRIPILTHEAFNDQLCIYVNNRA